MSSGPLSKDLQPHNLSGVLIETASQIPLHPPPPGSALTVLARQRLLGHPKLLEGTAAFKLLSFSLGAHSKASVWGVWPQRHVHCGGAVSPRRSAQSSGFMTVTGSLGRLGDKGATSPCAEAGASRPQEDLFQPWVDTAAHSPGDGNNSSSVTPRVSCWRPCPHFTGHSGNWVRRLPPTFLMLSHPQCVNAGP